MREKKIISPREVDEMIDRKLRDLKLIEGIVEPREIVEEDDKHHQRPHEKELHHPKLHEEIPHHAKTHEEIPHHKIEKLELHLEEKRESLIEIFGDESTAEAVIKTFKKSPIEIQLIAKMVIDLHEKINDILGE